MSLTNFRAEDFKSGGSKAAKKAPAKKSAPASEADENEVPEGSIDEVMDWVGDDQDRAQQALDAENARSKPRKTAVERLENVLEDDDESEGGDQE